MRTILYNDDLPLRRGVIYPFSGALTLDKDLLAEPIEGDCKGNTALFIKGKSFFIAWLLEPSIDGETFEGLQPI